MLSVSVDLAVLLLFSFDVYSLASSIYKRWSINFLSSLRRHPICVSLRRFDNGFRQSVNHSDERESPWKISH